MLIFARISGIEKNLLSSHSYRFYRLLRLSWLLFIISLKFLSHFQVDILLVVSKNWIVLKQLKQLLPGLIENCFNCRINTRDLR